MTTVNEKTLTANDPEPAIGSVVINRYQDYLRREPNGEWVTLPANRNIPHEQWASVADTEKGYGPVRVVESFVALPEHLELGEVIARLEREDPAKILPVGFAAPHSYRGDYSDLAFELRHNITVGEVLSAAQSALGATFQGWKGGDYQMRDYTDCWLVSAEGTSMGETLGALLLELLLNNGTVDVP